MGEIGDIQKKALFQDNSNENFKAPFWRGYVCSDNREIYEIEFTFNGEEFMAQCTCRDSAGGKLCKHIAQFLEYSPIAETIKEKGIIVKRIKE